MTHMPEGHEDHEVMGLLLEDGSTRPLFCNTCSVRWL